jgi:hypothetical protein
MASAITPDKKYLLVLNGGYNPPDHQRDRHRGRKGAEPAPVPDAWLGLTMTKAGDKVYVGGGSRAAVYEFSFAARCADAFARVPGRRGERSQAGGFHRRRAACARWPPALRRRSFHDSVVVINPQSGYVLSRIKTGRRPYRILFHPSGKSFYVSSWADGSIGQYDPQRRPDFAYSRVGPHTTDMVWLSGEVEDQPEVKARLFVSASNTNSVYVLGANEEGDSLSSKASTLR